MKTVDEIRNKAKEIIALTNKLEPVQPPVVPPKPPAKMKVIDGKLDYSKIKSGTKPWDTHFNWKNRTIKNTFWKRHGRIYFKKCEDLIFENLGWEQIYGFYFDYCKRITFRFSSGTDGRKPLNLARGCEEFTFEKVVSLRGLDPWAKHSQTGKTRFNGDGLIIEGNCPGNKIIDCVFNDSEDSGLDIKSDDNLVHNLTAKFNKGQGVKDWGRRNRYTGVTNLEGNGDWNFFKTRYVSTVDRLISVDPGQAHIRLGFSRTANKDKHLTVLSGTYNGDKQFVKPDKNSTQDINMMKV